MTQNLSRKVWNENSIIGHFNCYGCKREFNGKKYIKIGKSAFCANCWLKNLTNYQNLVLKNFVDSNIIHEKDRRVLAKIIDWRKGEKLND